MRQITELKLKYCNEQWMAWIGVIKLCVVRCSWSIDWLIDY
jgi:hypothetical protein